MTDQNDLAERLAEAGHDDLADQLRERGAPAEQPAPAPAPAAEPPEPTAADRVVQQGRGLLEQRHADTGGRWRSEGEED